MGLLRSLAMLLPLLCIIWSSELRAQSPGSSRNRARTLDALLQGYAYKAFPSIRPRTGIPYDGTVPLNLTGIRIQAIRLRSGSFRKRGVNYSEFYIPPGVRVQPYVERLALVYQSLGNWSLVYYPYSNYTYLAPVIGLLAYDASNLSATSLPELEIRAFDRPISIKFADVKSVPNGSTAKCIFFDLRGSVELKDAVSGNICSTFTQGHFSIVVESTAVPPPAPSPAPVPVPPTPTGENKNKRKTWIIVVSVLGGFLLLVLLGFLVVWLHKYKHRQKMQKMEKAADVGEALHMTSVGNTRAPVAMGTRTQPVLENEYAP